MNNYLNAEQKKKRRYMERMTGMVCRAAAGARLPAQVRVEPRGH